MPLNVKDANAVVRSLDPAAISLGVNTSDVGREFEVAGFIVTRLKDEVGQPAAGFAAEASGLGSLWTNSSYDPRNAGRGWKRTINMHNGNVGIGGEFDPNRGQAPPSERLVVQGNIFATGDVRLAGADCAEEFETEGGLVVDPGSVMVIGDQERVRECVAAYDSRVAGVISGAGDCRPGILLGRHPDPGTRIPLALTGKVYCRVDAGFGAIATGDLLTTSVTRGHAMRVSDPTRAFGAILGKALGPLAEGRGLIPILVSLQ